jgi:hypothetical protein
MIVLCPNRSRISASGAPPVTSQAAQVWRRSWKAKSSRFAALHAAFVVTNTQKQL